MHWKQELRTNVRTVEEFREFYPLLHINQDEILEIEDSIKSVGVNIPRQYLRDLIDSVTSEKQFAQVRKLVTPRLNPFIKDNVIEGVVFVEPTDQDRNPLRGLTRMYPDRVLVSPTHHCMLNCLWCYRTKDEASSLSRDELEAIYDYVRNDQRITDVILTGGEPLMTSDAKLETILEQLRRIEHVDIVRLHTRAPVVLPSRIDDSLLSLLKRYSSKKGKPIYVVTHYVHPLELSETSTDAIDRLTGIGISVFNQAPVLKGVNDDQETFNEWNKQMIKYKVKPYYVASPVISDGINSSFYVPLAQVEWLLRGYSKQYEGLGRPTLIIPVMGSKLTPAELDEHMIKHGAHVRRTKIETQ